MKKKIIFIAFINFLLASCSTQQLAVSDRDLDSDLDGVPDDKDDCPLVYGSPFNMGCPFSGE